MIHTFRALPKDTDNQLPHYQLNSSSTTKLRHVANELTNEQKYALLKLSGKSIFSVGDAQQLFDDKIQIQS